MSIWRPLHISDIAAVSSIARRVHPEFPEPDAVFFDRLALAPHTCFLLEIQGVPSGYVLAHPYGRGSAPALGTVLGALPENPDALYIHDLALLTLARGTGAAHQIVDTLAGLARPLGAMSLVAVNNSTPFWTRMGFAARTAPQLSARLSTYAPDAVYMVRDLDSEGANVPGR